MFIQVQIKENVKVPRQWHLWGEFTGDRWSPRIKGPVTRKMFPFDDVIMKWITTMTFSKPYTTIITKVYNILGQFSRLSPATILNLKDRTKSNKMTPKIKSFTQNTAYTIRYTVLEQIVENKILKMAYWIWCFNIFPSTFSRMAPRFICHSDYVNNGKQKELP